jgi:hypothetical protein
VQTQSAERSYTVAPEQIDNLPFNRQNFINAVQFTPGVILGGQGGAAAPPPRRAPRASAAAAGTTS